MTKQHQAGVQKSLQKAEISVMALYSQLGRPLCLPLHNLPDFRYDAVIHFQVPAQKRGGLTQTSKIKIIIKKHTPPTTTTTKWIPFGIF